MILGIDPGPKQSAYVFWDWRHQSIFNHGIFENVEFRHRMKQAYDLFFAEPLIPVIEMIQSFGMPVGKEIFETVLWIGRLIEIFNDLNTKLVYRRDIKIHFCGSPRAKDANIRQALIDRFGPPGVKKNAGILYGIKKDEWSALAIAVYYQEVFL